MRLQTIVIQTVIFCFFLAPVVILAQVRGEFILGSNERISDVAWKDSIYLYHEFQKGQITYDRGFTPENSWQMNYNIYFECMTFINRRGDTVLLNNPPALKLVTLGSDVFYLDKTYGFVQVLKTGNLTLAVRHYFLLKGEEIVQGVGGSGYAERERLIQQYSDMRGKTSHFPRIYQKTDTYFFIDPNNRIFPANTSTLLRALPDQRKDLRQYLVQHNPDFTNRKDLYALLEYCNRLQTSQ